MTMTATHSLLPERRKSSFPMRQLCGAMTASLSLPHKREEAYGHDHPFPFPEEEQSL